MNTTLFNQDLAEISVSYSHKVRPSDMKRISCSKDIFEQLSIIMEGELDYVEFFYIVLLNRANRILGYYQVSKGGLSGTVADPKVIFQVALKACASSIILAHNHPSGNLQPSDADRSLTKRLKEAGMLLDLPVMDHVILSSDGYYSFADEGCI